MPIDAFYNLNGGFKPTMKRSADLDGVDFYPTPAWATYALIDNERFEGDIWECACGDGSMTEVLGQTGRRVISSDLYDRGFGERGHDFLTSNRRAANIITNPPFHSAEGFVAQCHNLADTKFALLLRLAFLEGANRTRTIFHKHPPRACGSSASGSPSIPRAPRCAAAEPRRTRGSCGTRPGRSQRSCGGSSRAIRRHIEHLRRLRWT